MKNAEEKAVGAGRILIADDHPLMREGIRLALRAGHPDYEIDVAESIAEAKRMIEAHRDYGLLILDYELPDSNGMGGFLQLQQLLGDVPIAIVSAHEGHSISSAAQAAGAAGFLSKRQPLDVTVAAIGTILKGGSVYPADTGADDAMKMLRKRLDSLSPAQRRVLLALANGDLNKQIAGDLDVSEATIKAHLSAIFRKLGVNNRTQAILMMRPLTEPV
jgi:DNA-binding NarL/FixJ family response regulator